MSVYDGKKIVKTYTGVSLEIFRSFILELVFDQEIEFKQSVCFKMGY